MAARHNSDDSSNNSTLQTVTPGAVNASNTDFISTTRDTTLKANGRALQQKNNPSDLPEDNVVSYENTNDAIPQFSRAEVETTSKTDFQENVSTTENTNKLDTYALKTNKDTKNKNRHTGLSKIHNDDEESVKSAMRDLGTIKKNNEGISDGTVILGNEKTTENVIENVVKESISKNRRADEKLKTIEKLCHDKILSIKEITKNNFESSSPKNISKTNCDKEKDVMYKKQHTSHVVGKKDERELVYYPANATSVFDKHESHVTTGTRDDGNVAYRAGCFATHHLADVTVTRGKANYAMFLNILPQSGNVLQLTRETSSSSLKENQAQLKLSLDDFVEISLEVKKI